VIQRTRDEDEDEDELEEEEEEEEEDRHIKRGKAQQYTRSSQKKVSKCSLLGSRAYPAQFREREMKMGWTMDMRRIAMMTTIQRDIPRVIGLTRAQQVLVRKR